MIAICDAGLVSHRRGIGIVTARQSARARRVTKARVQRSVDTDVMDTGENILVATLIRPIGRKVSCWYN